MIVFTAHLAYKMTSAVVVYPSARADPEVVVDQPAKS